MVVERDGTGGGLEGFLGRVGGRDGLEGVDGEGVEEFVGEDERGFVWFWGEYSQSFGCVETERRRGEGLTVWNEADIFTPCNGQIGMFAGTSIAGWYLLKCLVFAT